MDTLLLLSRLILAGVFAVAGIAKLADPAGSRQALRGFGVPEPLAKPAAVALPLAELAVAIALIPRASAWWGGLGALLLLLAFVGGIAYNLVQGRAPDCHCFGQLHSSPAGKTTLIRNGVLAAVALFLVAFGWGDPGYSLVAWFGDLSGFERAQVASWVLLTGALGLLGWALVHLLGQNGRLLLRLDALEATVGGVDAVAASAPAPPVSTTGGLAVGSTAPTFALSGLYGETLTLDALRASAKPVLLLFTDPSCGPCNALLPDIGRWQRDHADALTVALISRGSIEANRAKSAEHAIARVLLQQDREVSQAYLVNGTPGAVVVRHDGLVDSVPALGADAIRALVARVVEVPVKNDRPNPASRPASGPASAPAPAQAPTAPARGPALNGSNGSAPIVAAVATTPTLGDPAPAFALPDLDGQTVALADFRGDPTLVVFWNPGCGFCRRMVDDLKAWETNPPADAPRLLLVSTGTAEANRELGLTSPTLLDEGFTIGRTYGAGGTPSAVLVDAQGNLASGVAVGSPGVLALARGEDPATAVDPNPPAPPIAPKIGDPAPALSLPDLDGNVVTLDSLAGSRTMLLFWSPGCGHCARMLEDLQAWEIDPPVSPPKLVLVSSGSDEANRDLGLRSTVLRDESFRTGSSFGSTGTPSAILIDESGRIASNLVIGAPSVLALANLDPVACQSCIDECKGRGGGDACHTVCRMTGVCV